ncbi:RDD family protein [Paraliobacillus sp. JSM ZJ581]|uniref:RDD family protein n=1 Tax=Paraliobacillus sp. JSM ZJ581 TaxID=3342118 RepID=UPI0035A8FE1A
MTDWYGQQTDIRTPEFVSLQFQVAGLGSRAAAFIIDQFILLIVNTILFIGLLLVMDTDFNLFYLFDNGGLLIAIVIILFFIINFGYYIFFEFLWGGKTIGKRVIGLRVIQDSGHPMTLLSSVIRNMMRLVDALPSLYFVGMLLVFLHPKHKRLGDLTAGTIVIYDNQMKKRNKKSVIDKIIDMRRLSKNDLILNDMVINQFTQKDWELLNTFCQRYDTLPLHEKRQLTYEIAEILFPKLDLTIDNKSVVDTENTLFILYLYLKDQWAYDWHA